MPEQKLLIIHQGALGDFILTFPAFIQLKKYFFRIDVLCQQKLGQLACNLKLAERCLPLESARFVSLYGGTPDSKIISLLSAYQVIILFSFSKELERSLNTIRGPIIRRIPPRPARSKTIHVTQYLLQSLSDLKIFRGSNIKIETRLSKIPHSDLRDSTFEPAKIMIHPGSGSPKKNWPLNYFIETERMLHSAGLTPEFIIGPAEKSLSENLSATDTSRIVHLMHDLNELVHLLKTAGGYLGNDSGVSHLAAFLGLPTVAIFGPSDPQRWRPIGRAVRMIKPVINCRHCFETNSNDCDQFVCLEKIAPNQVIEALYEIWRR